MTPENIETQGGPKVNFLEKVGYVFIIYTDLGLVSFCKFERNLSKIGLVELDNDKE